MAPGPQVVDIYSVSSCQCENFADYIPFWKHNGYWFFDSPEIIKNIARDNAIQLEGTSLYLLRGLRNGIRRRKLETMVTRAVVPHECDLAFQEAA